MTLVFIPQAEMAAAVADRRADAISMWEPEARRALKALGGDAVVFQDNTVYRELFSLDASTDVLKDAKRRGELVAFVHTLRLGTSRRCRR